MIITSKQSGRAWDLRSPRKRKRGVRYSGRTVVVHVVDLTEVELAEEQMYADMEKSLDAEVRKLEETPW